MDLRVFYQKIRQIEKQITQPHAVVLSRDTPDGGTAGCRSEVTREIAARLIVEGRAVLATAEEALAFYEEIQAARRAAEQSALSQRLQVNVISDSDMKALQTSTKEPKR